MLTWILGAGAALCLGYYVIIVLYAGFSTSFSWVWIAMAALLLAQMAGIRYYRNSPGREPLWLPVSLATICVTAVAVFAIVEVLVFSGVASPDTPNLDYLVVLGARVRDDRISNSLRFRLDKAAEYIEGNPDTVLVLSGGQGPDEPASEALAMQRYLLGRGVRKERMLLEEQSASTLENLAYSKLLIEQDLGRRRQDAKPASKAPGPYLEVEGKPPAIGVLTSNYHVYRARKIAEKRGFSHVYGIASQADPVLFIHFCVRECAAILKDKLMGNM